MLGITEAKSIKNIAKAISKTLDRKINHKNKKNRIVSELKGKCTTLQIKKSFLTYFDADVKDYVLYAIVLNKSALLKDTQKPIADRIYNHMTHQLLEKIHFSADNKQVNLIVDRSKDNFGIKEFNDYLYANLNMCLNLETALYITHDNSEKHKGIQAVDMFCYGIARKYEQEDESWYNLFKDKIAIECQFNV